MLQLLQSGRKYNINELKIFNKVYKDRHFGYNFWKWALSKFKSQKDIFTKEERIKIFEMMQKEFNIKEDYLKTFK